MSTVVACCRSLEDWNGAEVTTALSLQSAKRYVNLRQWYIDVLDSQASVYGAIEVIQLV